jgi:probable F420-dependent oxidoreductase
VFGTLTDRGIRIDELAREVEARGFDSLWLGEHSHVPVAVASHPREDGRPLPDFYKRLPDPFVQLGAAAAVTSRITLGTAVCLIVEHDPIMLAKQVATLDHIADGRFKFGVGYGWNALEMKHHGVDVKDKREVFREKLLAMRSLWEQEIASYHGRFVQFEDSYAWPKPVQKRLPVLIGAEAGPKTVNDIVELAEGWIPMDLRGGGERLPAQLALLRRRLEEAGTPHRTLDLTLLDPLLAFSDHEPDEFKRRLPTLRGPSLVEQHGLSGLVIGIPYFDRDRALRHLDAAAAHFLA